MTPRFSPIASLLRLYGSVILIACSCSLSHAQITSEWENFSNFDALHKKVSRNLKTIHGNLSDKTLKFLGQIIQDKTQAESWMFQLGIPDESVSYHLWTLTRDNAEADSSISFALPEDILSHSSNIHLIAVRIIGDNRWQHPYDQPANPEQEQAHCVSLPNHFLVRYYHLRDKSRNESLNIADLSDGNGFSLFVYLPPSPPTPAKVFLIRVCVFVSHSLRTSSPQTPDPPQEPPSPTSDLPPASSTPTEPPSRRSERDSGSRNRGNQNAQRPSRSTDPPQTDLEHIKNLVRRINPRWKIEDVSPDGNCGYWAALRSLQDLQLRDNSQELRQLANIPATYNALYPKSEDYKLMNLLRKETSEETVRRLITNNWNALRSCLADALSLREIEGRPADPRGSLILPPTLQPEDIQMGKIKEMALLFFNLGAKLLQEDLSARVDSSTNRSLDQFRREAEQKSGLDQIYYRQYLKVIPHQSLWFEVSFGGLGDMAKALKLPVMAIGRVRKTTVSFHDGSNEYSFTCGDDQDPENFADSIRGHISGKYPKLVKFIHNGTNHFLAIVEKNDPHIVEE